MTPSREPITKARRLVVKIGSRALARGADVQARLAREIADVVAGGRSVVVVSSGAIALGCERLGYDERPKEMGKLQAAAAAGQSVLMRRYDEAFGRAGLTAAQVLLTHADLADRERLNNARDALGALLDAGALPIVNENDTVSTEEIRFGDNDQLAAMVVPLVGAELLVLLTDVDGVLDAGGERIPILSDPEQVGDHAPTGGMGSGGMTSKLAAAHKATMSGANVVVVSGLREGALAEVVAGEDVGTLLPARGTTLRARKHWIAFTLKPRGAVVIDEGAVRAVRSGTKSLLPVGVLGVRGDFHTGDAVVVLGPDGGEVGRGLARMGALDVARSAGRKNEELALLFGPDGRDLIVVHKDDLVVDPNV